MIKYFYLVDFEYITNDNIETLNLGIFSTKQKALNKINSSFYLPGFKNYGIENFKTIKFGVDFDYNVIDKTNVILYCVSHEYVDANNGYFYWNIFDYFSTKKKAIEKVEYLKKHSRIGKKYPDNFDIIEIPVDNFNDWSEGFVELNKNELQLLPLIEDTDPNLAKELYNK